jgi:glyoxylase-like metal-dependent hydrolase (beta-lactamase superfamily II)
VQRGAVEQVVPGMWSVPVPIPHNPLGHTLVYVFETPRGPVLVDAGWDDPTSWQILSDGIAATGHDVSDVYGVLVTHMHPDHHGLSGRIQEDSGCWVAMHPDDTKIVAYRGDDEEWLVQTSAVLLDAGADEAELAKVPAPTGEFRRPDPGVVADRELHDGEQVDVPGWSVHAVWTPGHSPGHTCFRVSGPDLLLSGDHVLPGITPHIGLYNPQDPLYDPLGDFLQSLRKVDGFALQEVLPAHQHRFTGLSTRVMEMIGHHLERLESIEQTLATGPHTTWHIAVSMPWNRPWKEIPVLMKRAAVSEALAHIRYLERRGRVELVPGAWPTTYRLNDGASTSVLAG